MNGKSETMIWFRNSSNVIALLMNYFGANILNLKQFFFSVASTKCWLSIICIKWDILYVKLYKQENES